MCRDLEVRLIMNLGLRLGLMMCRDLKILLGLLLELLEERELEMLLLALLHKIIFFVSIFLSRRSSYPDSPPTPNQFQYPRQDQMTLNILLLI